MARELLSLREIGRRLDVPPSSIVYYKDRFARFIPTAGGKGRRVKYPPEAVTLFKEIREMFERNLSAEEIEAHLSERDGYAGVHHAGLSGAGAAGFGGASAGFVQELSGVLEKMSGLLEAQAGFRQEIGALRDELSALRHERDEQAARYEETIRRLEQEMEILRAGGAYRAAGDRTEGSARGASSGRSGGAAPRPPASFLGRPLVIHRGGEYIGVVGRGKPFTLAMLIQLIERNAGSQKVQGMEWQYSNGQWLLVIHSRDAAGTQQHRHELRVVRTTTPSGNTVTQLCSLCIDGEDVPDNFLLALFKSIKDGLEG